MILDVSSFGYGVGLVMTGFIAGVIVGFAFRLVSKIASF
jgi:hypothetical protein